MVYVYNIRDDTLDTYGTCLMEGNQKMHIIKNTHRKELQHSSPAPHKSTADRIHIVTSLKLRINTQQWKRSLYLPNKWKKWWSFKYSFSFCFNWSELKIPLWFSWNTDSGQENAFICRQCQSVPEIDSWCSITGKVILAWEDLQCRQRICDFLQMFSSQVCSITVGLTPRS